MKCYDKTKSQYYTTVFPIKIKNNTIWYIIAIIIWLRSKMLTLGQPAMKTKIKGIIIRK